MITRTLDDCALQLSHNGTYLDLESSLSEQRDELEGFQEDTAGTKGKKHSVVLRTQLTVRVHACIEKLYNSNGRDLRRALFSLKQIFQDDKDLVHEFVMAEGLTCLIKVGAEVDQNYQHYILGALGQIMLYVDGMNGVICHLETIEWLYALTGSKFRRVVKTALKLLLVFVEYSESNTPLLIQTITTVDTKRGCKHWSNVMEILDEKDGVDTELMVYAMTLINKTLSALPDQESFYDMVDGLEDQGMEAVAKRFLGRRGTDLDLMEQLTTYEATLLHEDGDDDSHPPTGLSCHRDRRHASFGDKRRGLERRRSCRASLGRSGNASPFSPSPQRSGFQPFRRRGGEDLSEREEEYEEEEDEAPITESDSDGMEGPERVTISETLPRRSTQNQSAASPSQLAALLARRKSSVTVPATNEIITRGTNHLSPERMPYLPHSPFHLFSYDFDEEPMPQATQQEVDSKATAAARTGVQRTPATPANKQHQESLSAERERRRAEREERLQRIEREERNKHSRDDVDKMAEARMARDERYKHVERMAAEEFEKDRLPRSRPDLSLTFDPVEARPLASFRSSTTHSSLASQDEEQEPEEPDTEPDLEPEEEETETPVTPYTETEQLKPEDFTACLEPEEEEAEEEEAEEEEAEEEGAEEEGAEEENKKREKPEQEAEEVKEETRKEEREDGEEDSGILSDKERQNEDVNEKDNCSASSSQWTQSVEEVDVNERCSKRFMDMLYSQSEEKEKGVAGKANQEAVRPPGEGEESKSAPKNDSPEKHPKKTESHSNVRVFAERFGDLVKGLGSPHPLLHIPRHKAPVGEQEKPPPPPPKKESDTIWDQLLASPRELRIGDIDFTDLKEEDDEDILDAGLMGEPPLFQKKKTIRLFWSEVRPSDYQDISSRSSGDSLWIKLEPVKIDTSRLEQLFQTKSKEIPVTKKTAADGKRQEVIVLDSKRSNAINIGLTVLPPPRTIKTAILNFDEYALNKEGIEKILTMIPSEEEKQKIQEAQQANPDVPLGSAEQFLLTLSSISELSARLQLWAFKMDYEAIEREVAEPLQDVKEGMEQLEKNKTLRYILSTLLAIGNFLNGTNAKGFELSYLEKVPEVKDTVHKQSLLHHACSIVVDNYPQSTDLYSEIGAITRSAKVDFDQLQDNLTMMEHRCKASWDHLKVIAKHEMKPTLKQKMSDFLKDCAERIIILKIVHRRIINRFHAFLLYLGHPAYGVREISVHRFSKILSEFALEYRTTRDRVLQQRQKRADHRERNKTRGKMIIDVSTPSDEEEEMESPRWYVKSSSAPGGGVESLQPQGLGHTEDAAEHEFMKAVLKTSLHGGDRETSVVPGLRTRTKSRPVRGGRVQQAWTPPAAVGVESQRLDDDEADEIMDRIVRSATQGPSQRAVPRERRRSRANRKSLRRTLKSGLTPEETLLLGLSDASEMPM
ncbi:hypothetical protein J4Q44_G00066180 [Coregonus suidteri]|uniref:FH1/FH2 domain-containing protein 3-like n=1 Tax=Coregonus suidteri TaxID=861788 RepID=A0AAN8M7Y1_9TELE